MEQLGISFKAAYNWADTFDVASEGLFTRGGRIAGSWSWRFSDGTQGNSHFVSASFFRLEPYVLAGTIAFNMWEVTRAAPGSDILYLAYDGLSSTPDGITEIEGRFTGGRGRYAGATGTLRWTSINGFIDNGEATLLLPSATR